VKDVGLGRLYRGESFSSAGCRVKPLNLFFCCAVSGQRFLRSWSDLGLIISASHRVNSG
jgi:hypothetical protein